MNHLTMIYCAGMIAMAILISPAAIDTEKKFRSAISLVVFWPALIFIEATND